MQEILFDSLGNVEGESKMHRAVLIEYAKMAYPEGGEMGAVMGRSLRVLAMQTHHSENALEKWSSRFNWVARVAAFDAALQEWRARLWQERRLSVDDQDYQDGARLRRAANMILDQVEVKLLNGEDVPAGVAGNYLERGSKIQRLATGAPTERTEQQMSDEMMEYMEQLNRIWANAGKKDNEQPEPE